MSEIKLLKCPFCGGEARMIYSVLLKYDAYVRCKCCGARTMEFSSASLQNAKLKAIQSWNTRKPMQEIVERMEGIQESLFLARDSIGNEIYKDVEAHQKAQRLLSKEIAFEEAINIVKEVGGLNGRS